MWYARLADLIVLVHLLFVGFVVLGLPVVWIGCGLRWKWIRNRWFRISHLAAITLVAVQALLGIMCPLTVWEYALRRKAGQATEDISFVGRLMRDILFYEAPDWVFTTAYVSFAVLVLGTLWFIPAQWRHLDKAPSAP